ncbi:MAG: hypothetical protein QOE60_2394 [Thermoleophilaceae bacterium]|jgi:hypothetical protein|nr:hypothetical protein [Thermoleophilaceae bacterium]
MARIARQAALALAALLLLAGPAEARLPKRTIEAREAFFGAANVDKRGEVRRDRVILSWFGVASFAAALDGKVVLLDTYLNNYGPTDCPPQPTAQRYVPAGYDDLIALRPEAIFIGHEHFDHQCRSGEIASRTGARLVGLPQACAVAKAEAPGKRIRCVPTLGSLSDFGTKREIRPLGARVPVTVIRNLHSGLASGPIMNSTGAEALMYRFRIGRFSLVWNDTVGPLREKSPRLLDVLRELPPTDVQVGASKGFGQIEQGLRDPVDYAQALRAKVYYSNHQDFYLLEGGRLDGRSRAMRPDLFAAFRGRRGLRTDVHWLQDPGDYLRPLVFNPTARRFAR